MSIDYDRLQEKLDTATPDPWWFRYFSGTEHPVYIRPVFQIAYARN